MAMIRYTRGGGDDDRDGESWSKARPFAELASDLDAAERGDVFLVGFDRDREDPVYWRDTTLTIRRSGAQGDPVRVAAGYVSQNANVQPVRQRALFRRSGAKQIRRTDPELEGPPFMVLTDGASHLQIAGFGFFGSPPDGFISFTPGAAAEFTDIGIRGLSATMAGRVIEADEETSVTGLLVEDCDAFGLVRGFARFPTLSNAVFRNLYLDAGAIDAGGTNVCQLIAVRAGSNLRFENIWLKNAVNGLGARERGSRFIQGDGIVCEEETSELVFRNCHASAMGDGGFDLKGQNILMEDCSAYGCKNGVRIWAHASNVLRRCSLTNPMGARQEATALWCAGSADLVDCRLQAGSGTTILRFAEGDQPPLVRIFGGEIVQEEDALLIDGEPGTLELYGVVVNGRLRNEIIESRGAVR